jgi:hypothetical protein
MADKITLPSLDAKVTKLGEMVIQELNALRNLVLSDADSLALYKGGRPRILLQDNRSFILDRNASGTPNNITDVAAFGGGWWRLEGIPTVTAAMLGANPTATLQSVIDNALATSVEFSGVISNIGKLNPKGKTMYLKPEARLVARPATVAEIGGSDHYGMFDLNSGGRIIGTGTIDGNKSFRTGENAHGLYWSNTTAPVYIQGPTFTGFAGDVIRCQSVAPPSIKDITITGNNARGIHIIETNDPLLDSIRIDGGTHGIQWWSGTSRWCQNVKITNCQVRDVSGSGIWGYRGLGVTITGGSTVNCGDYGVGFEGCMSSTATGVSVVNGRNAGLAFYNGCENVSYSDCNVIQGIGMGPGIKSFAPNATGVGKNRNISMQGGSIVCVDTMTPVNTDQDCTEDFRLNFVSLRGSWVQFLDANFVKVTNCTIYTKAEMGIRNLGGSYCEFKQNRIFYTGNVNNTANEIVMTYRSEQYPAAYNIIEGNAAYNFGGGCFDDDQNNTLSSSGNKFVNNQTNAPVKQNKANYALTCKGNYKIDGSLVDGWERQFTRIVTNKDQQGYVPFLTLPKTGENTYDHAVVVASMGNFEGGLKKVFTLSVGQRDGLSVNNMCQGDNDVAPGSVVAYKKADGRTIFYLKLGVFAEASISYTSLQLAQGVDRLQLSTEVPSGDLVYNSATNKPNLEVGSAGVKSFGVLIGAATTSGLLDSVATYADLANKAVAGPTLVNVENDESTSRIDVLYYKTQRGTRQLGDVEYTDGQ